MPFPLDQHFGMPNYMQAANIAALFSNEFMNEERWSLDDVVKFIADATAVSQALMREQSTAAQAGILLSEAEQRMIGDMVNAITGAERARRLRTIKREIILTVQEHAQALAQAPTPAANDHG